MNIDIRRPIDNIEFSLFGNDEIKNISALGRDSAGVKLPDLFENGEPKRGGLIDPRFGTTDENIPCETCGFSSAHCVGHFGHIILENYMFHSGFLVYIRKILGCVCLKCSKLLVYKNEKELNDIIKNKTGKNRLIEIKNLVKDVAYCQRPGVGCGAPVSKIKLDTKKTDATYRLIAEIKLDNKDENGDVDKKIQRVLTPEDCYNILKNISDEDCAILGLNPKKCRPEEMIHKIFPVPPVAVRPSVRREGTSLTSEDDLTRKLADVIKRNEQLSKSKDSLQESKVGLVNQTQLLQCHIDTYFGNDPGMMAKSDQKGKATKSLSIRLKGKEGRFRSNLMGKRVDFSARTVITPDPSIDVNQVGVPMIVAMNLTYPEVVTPYNLEEMKKLIKNGKDVYPGANFVIKKGNFGGKDVKISLMYRKDNIELKYGDVVERHLNESDIVLLNRQPTLHKQSMMGHYAHIIRNPNYTSFRVNVGVTAPYNADYDGNADYEKICRL